MLDFLKEHWDEILSIVGAAAWLPIIILPILNYFRKVRGTILDARILTNGDGISADRKDIKKGTILMLVTNLYINKMALFAKNISVRVKVENSGFLNAELLDFSTITSRNDDQTESYFSVKVEQEFNISRTIHPDTDNIKYIAVLVEHAAFRNLSDISEIEIVLYYGYKKCRLFSKSIVLTQSDFPKFNSTHLIDAVERVEPR